MRLRYATATAAGFVAAVAVAAAAFGQTASPAAREQGTKADKVKARGKDLVHSERKVKVKEGFATVIVDRGEVTSVDGSTITIRRADGESVTVTAGQTTKVRRDGRASSVSAIQPGDRARVMQVVRDGTTTVRSIRAFSKEFEPQKRSRRGPKGDDARARGRGKAPKRR